jgi:acetyl esterase/lipase
MFKAGINADTAFFSAGGFWRGAQVRALYRTIFGGPPLDPRYSDNYRGFSPSARGQHFSGPLLQMFTAESAPTAVELDQALKEAKVPTELIGYPDETHVLHRPRSIASAARRTIDWFDYWLLGRENADSPQPEQYRRWRAMKFEWERAMPPAWSGPPATAK